MSNDPELDPDSDSQVLSSTPTPLSHLHRTLSHNSSQWSASDTPQHHHEGTSYFPAPHSPSTRHNPHPILVRTTSTSSTRRGHRSTSVSSSHVTTRGFRDDSRETLSEEDEDEDDVNVEPRGKSVARSHASSEEEEEDVRSDREEDPITLRDRQSLINVEHPFGLPIWKPALYKKSRSVTRYADEALHSIPSAQAERHLLPGNIFWIVCFGWWLSLTCFLVSAFLRVVPHGGKRYSSLIFGLGWYLAWPFGKYVEGDVDATASSPTDEVITRDRRLSEGSDGQTVRGVPSSFTNEVDNSGGVNHGVPLSEHPTITPSTFQPHHSQSVSWNPVPVPGESTSLLARLGSGISEPASTKSYGATSSSSNSSASVGALKESSLSKDWLGRACFWLTFVSIIAPLMLIVCIVCWGLVITIPMAKLNWALVKYMFAQPTTIRFCAAPPAVVVASDAIDATTNTAEEPAAPSPPQFSVKHPRLAAGQAAPSGSPTSTVLLCTYRAVGWQYYKYTVGGVNILFVNLLPIVFFVIFDGLVLLPMVARREKAGKHVPALLAAIASRGLIFFLSLLSVIPLSYFIGMAVASISAQSSIGMGAVINATFGSVIEVILYGLALSQGKGHLVEGSIVGSFLAGVLLMPGMSMCSGALRRKEQKFNAKSAGVTSMMLIMAVIGTLTPTLFYQTYGNFQLVCSGCPSNPGSGDVPWMCDHCYYQHPDPVDDPFYQSTVKTLMYFCAAILLFSYLIGLWFSLRTHASQIWQNPQQLLHPMELPIHHRLPVYQKPVPGGNTLGGHRSLYRKPSIVTNLGSEVPSRVQTPLPREPPQPSTSHGTTPNPQPIPGSPNLARRVSYAPGAVAHQVPFTPVLESVGQAVKNTGFQTMQLPENMTTDDFTRAVAVATVSALRHQQAQAHAHSPARLRNSATLGDGDGHGDGGHEAPSWSRTTSASVLLACTALYAVIAELLVEVVDVILEGSGIDEKFLGVTLFALVPNTTEFMNAISFALNGNIALSMEIGSAYALQVCLLQIPAMVAFSAWYAPDKMGEVAKTFTLIFPRWDTVVIILSVFLMTYTYIEAKSNYHRGSILILSYLVLTAGFYFAPHVDSDVEEGHFAQQVIVRLSLSSSIRWFFSSLWSF